MFLFKAVESAKYKAKEIAKLAKKVGETNNAPSKPLLKNGEGAPIKPNDKGLTKMDPQKPDSVPISESNNVSSQDGNGLLLAAITASSTITAVGLKGFYDQRAIQVQSEADLASMREEHKHNIEVLNRQHSHELNVLDKKHLQELELKKKK